MRYRLTSDKWDVTLDILGAGAAVVPSTQFASAIERIVLDSLTRIILKVFLQFMCLDISSKTVLGYLQYYLVVREKTAQAPSGQNQKYTLNSK